MHVIQESYIPLESGDHKYYFILSVFKVDSWIKLSIVYFENIALKWEFSCIVPRPHYTYELSLQKMICIRLTQVILYGLKWLTQPLNPLAHEHISNLGIPMKFLYHVKGLKLICLRAYARNLNHALCNYRPWSNSNKGSNLRENSYYRIRI